VKKRIGQRRHLVQLWVQKPRHQRVEQQQRVEGQPQGLAQEQFNKRKIKAAQ